MTGSPYARLVVTGAAGFVGGHMLDHLLRSADRPGCLVALDIRKGRREGVEWETCDLAEPAAAAAAIRRWKPDGIIHLAAVTHGDDLAAFFRANVQASANLLAAACSLHPRPRVLVFGSAAQYGIAAREDERVDESHPLRGSTPYAVSKTVQEQWALLVGRAAPMHVTCIRPFNLLGPGQPADLVPATFLHQIARAVDGEIEEVLVGNTDTARDFIDVRDMAAATWALMKSDKVSPGAVFNLCSGEPVTIEEMLRACLELAGRPVPVRCDATRLKAFDVPKIVGNPAKLRSVTDWRPRISWKQSLEDMWHALRHEH